MTIHRNTNYIVAITNCDTNCFGENEYVEYYKNEYGWHCYVFDVNECDYKSYRTTENLIRQTSKEFETQATIELPKEWKK